MVSNRPQVLDLAKQNRYQNQRSGATAGAGFDTDKFGLQKKKGANQGHYHRLNVLYFPFSEATPGTLLNQLE